MASKRSAHRTHAHLPQHVTEAADPLARLTIRGASPHGGYGWVPDLPDARELPLLRAAVPLSAGPSDRSRPPA
jgi:hypothetical protein